MMCSSGERSGSPGSYTWTSSSCLEECWTDCNHHRSVQARRSEHTHTHWVSMFWGTFLRHNDFILYNLYILFPYTKSTNHRTPSAFSKNIIYYDL